MVSDEVRDRVRKRGGGEWERRTGEGSGGGKESAK